MLSFLVFVSLVALCSAQFQPRPNPLHEICHSSRLQLREDQVIEQVVNDIDINNDGRVDQLEVIVFFVDMLDVDLGPVVLATIGEMDVDDLRTLGAGIVISKGDFVSSWHSRYHDSVDFVEATFDSFDLNHDGRLDVVEMENIVTIALFDRDVNADGTLENSELAIFLERIYHNC